MITEKYPIFTKEKKLNDNTFLINHNNTDYIIRLYPFAIFQIDSKEIENIQFSDEIIKFDFQPVKPFSSFLPLLILTNSCNLACKYCYAYKGSYGEEENQMSFSVIDKSIEFIRDSFTKSFKPSNKITEYELGIICFGGEPLLSFKQVKYVHDSLVELCSSFSNKYNIIFKPIITINTNGLILNNEIISFMSENKKNIELVVSHDGWTHDEYRLSHNNKGTSKIVFENILKLKKQDINISVTSCILPKAVSKHKETLKSLNVFFQNKIPVNISFIRGELESVREFSAYPGIIQEKYGEKDLVEFGNAVAQKIDEGAIIFSERFMNRLSEGGYQYRCGAGLYEFAVMPKGDVYPCHNFISDDYKIGNIKNNDLSIGLDNSFIKQLSNRTVSKLSPCNECVLQTICLSSFDCPSHSLQDCGNLFSVDTRFCGFARNVQGTVLKKMLNEKL